MHALRSGCAPNASAARSGSPSIWFRKFRQRTVRPTSRPPAELLDGIENRLLLDPLFRGAYPDDVRRFYAPVSDFGFVQDGDLAAINRPIDFLGVNFYEQHLTRADPSEPERKTLFSYPGERRTAMNVGVNPEGLLDVLTRVRRDYADLPIYITENGMACFDYLDPSGRVRDHERIDFLAGHFAAVREAIARGVDVRGYVVWSMLDTFEWQAWLLPQLRPDPYRLRDATANLQGQRLLVCRGDRGERQEHRGARQCRDFEVRLILISRSGELRNQNDTRNQ